MLTPSCPDLSSLAIELHGLFLRGETIVQGDEGPVHGVAQVVDCHGVTVGHEEKKEEVEGTAKGREWCACRRTHFSVANCHSYLFVNFCIRRYCIYISRR